MPQSEEGFLESQRCAALNLAADAEEGRARAERAEQALRKLNAELEQRVQDRTAELARKAALITAVNDSQANFISAQDSMTIFDGLLKRLLSLTASEYGFIDELLYKEDGNPYLTARAITNIAWNDETRALYPQFLTGRLHFDNLRSLFGAVITTRAPVIANDAPNDPRRCGLPPGHPPLHAFLGLPMFAGEDFVGVIGLANAPAGYSEETIAYLAPLVGACANILMSWRNEQRRQQAMEEVRKLNARLEQRTAELATANKELEAFAYSVSHDLRAPLRAIDGFSRILLEDYSDRLDAEGQGYLQRVRAASQRMGKLIDDILHLSRISRAPLNRQSVDLSSLAGRILGELHTAEPQRQVEVLIAPGLVAQGDPGLLEVVLQNLLGNAWKFTGKTTGARIEIGATEHEGQPAFFVRDNGAGFDMAYVDRLFGAFQRLHTEDEFPGTGIGLATVQRIIRRHGGRVWAEGEVGKGATFYFAL